MIPMKKSLPTANDEILYIDNLQKGKYVAVKDTDHPNDTKYSVAKVIEIDDDLKIATLSYYGTKTANMRHAVWQPLLVWQRPDPAKTNTTKTTYKLGSKPSTRFKWVQDTIPLDDPAQDFSRVVHCDIKLLPSGRVAKKSIVQLQDMGLTNHQLGKTF